MIKLSTIELRINDKVVEVSAGLTILQACETAGVQVPRFCYHNDLFKSVNSCSTTLLSDYLMCTCCHGAIFNA